MGLSSFDFETSAIDFCSVLTEFVFGLAYRNPACDGIRNWPACQPSRIPTILMRVHELAYLKSYLQL
jgi:hypothetical protein